jgi:hypothetical protein
MADVDLRESSWYSVRCVFEVLRDGRAYEERVTLWLAPDIDQALVWAEQEADAYAAGLVGCDYLGLAQAYQVLGGPVHGAEVFSLTRESELDPQPYLDAFFDTGSERQSSERQSNEGQSNEGPPGVG